MVRLLACTFFVLWAVPAAAQVGMPDWFIRGDAYQDGSVTTTDAIFILEFIFSDGEAPGCMDSADADDDGHIALADVMYILNFAYSQGNPPPSPYPGCGPDPTEDDLGCDDYDQGLCE